MPFHLSHLFKHFSISTSIDDGGHFHVNINHHHNSIPVVNTSLPHHNMTFDGHHDIYHPEFSSNKEQVYDAIEKNYFNDIHHHDINIHHHDIDIHHHDIDLPHHDIDLHHHDIDLHHHDGIKEQVYNAIEKNHFKDINFDDIDNLHDIDTHDTHMHDTHIHDTDMQKTLQHDTNTHNSNTVLRSIKKCLEVGIGKGIYHWSWGAAVEGCIEGGGGNLIVEGGEKLIDEFVDGMSKNALNIY